jgi:CRP-like cAMP-binding protein
VLALAERRREVGDAINRSLVEHCQALRNKIQVMGAGSVAKRLATLLLWLAERYGDQLDDDELTIPIAISRGELASLISARIETTIRAMRGWERSGVIQTLADGFRICRPAVLEALTRAENRGRGSRPVAS